MSVSQPYGCDSLLCGCWYVISTNSYVEYITKVKSTETNDTSLTWCVTWGDSVKYYVKMAPHPGQIVVNWQFIPGLFACDVVIRIPSCSLS